MADIGHSRYCDCAACKNKTVQVCAEIKQEDGQMPQDVWQCQECKKTLPEPHMD